MHQNPAQLGLRAGGRPGHSMKAADRTRLKGWLHRLGHSLRWRLLALFIVLATALSAAFITGTKHAFSTGWRDAVKPLLTDYVDRLALEIGSPPDARKAQRLVERLPISIRIDGPVTRFDSHLDRNNHTWQRSSRSYGSDEKNQNFLKRQTADGHSISFGLGNMEWRRGVGMFSWLTLALLLLLTALAFAYVRRLFKPLDDISAGVQRFGAGNFSQPIRVNRSDELGDLAGQINTMGLEISRMLEAKRALLLAISHELRSPLTRIRLNVELLPDSADTHGPRQALLGDLAEMAQLINDLLESERLSGDHAALNLEETDLGELALEVAGSLKDIMPLALSIEADLPLIDLDRTRVRLLLRNLADNAKRHGQPTQQAIEVSVCRTSGSVELAVRDFGPGIAADQLPKLGQAFFRSDAARQRSTGGVGLGLYLCRLVAQAHGGQLMLENACPGLRASVCFRLP